MSIYLDLKYINLISNRLPLFKKRGDTLFNFRCVLCGDSSSKKNKARGYFYRVANKNKMSMKCHNCGASMYFGSFLKTFAPAQYREYIIEEFKDNNNTPRAPEELFEKKMSFKEPSANSESLLDSLLDRLDTLPDDNEAKQFCLKRKLPREAFDRLYYIDDMRKMSDLSDKYKDKLETEEPRLVIPFYGPRGDFEGVTCRGLRGESLRYITLRIKEDGFLIFGAERVDVTKKVYATEGPLDSLFLPNSIAVGGVSFGKVQDLKIPKNNLTMILDNQPRNKDVCRQYKKYIDEGFKIVIWPVNQEEKDINDLVLSGASPESVKILIDEYTAQGTEAMLKFSLWKRI